MIRVEVGVTVCQPPLFRFGWQGCGSSEDGRPASRYDRLILYANNLEVF